MSLETFFLDVLMITSVVFIFYEWRRDNKRMNKDRWLGVDDLRRKDHGNIRRALGNVQNVSAIVSDKRCI
jgi:hypothetical protein